DKSKGDGIFINTTGIGTVIAPGPIGRGRLKFVTLSSSAVIWAHTGLPFFPSAPVSNSTGRFFRSLRSRKDADRAVEILRVHSSSAGGVCAGTVDDRHAVRKTNSQNLLNSTCEKGN